MEEGRKRGSGRKVGGREEQQLIAGGDLLPHMCGNVLTNEALWGIITLLGGSGKVVIRSCDEHIEALLRHRQARSRVAKATTPSGS